MLILIINLLLSTYTQFRLIIKLEVKMNKFSMKINIGKTKVMKRKHRIEQVVKYTCEHILGEHLTEDWRSGTEIKMLNDN